MARGFADAGAGWLAALARGRPGGRQEGGPQEAGHPAEMLEEDGRRVGGPAPPRGDNALPFASTGPHGHRRRMRERLLTHGGAGLADYEVLEMLLFLGIARRDTKPLAKALINEFGSLRGVLSAGAMSLAAHGLPEECAALLRLPDYAAARLAAAESRDRPILNNWEKLLAYFEQALTGAVAGQLRALFLDNRNRLLADEVVEDASTVASTSAAGAGEAADDTARLAMRRALDLHATALILVRVAPPGPIGKPLLAREAQLASHVARAAQKLAIVLHDHIAVGGEHWVSLRQKGLIGTAA